jgi:hypothetical protein
MYLGNNTIYTHIERIFTPWRSNLGTKKAGVMTPISRMGTPLQGTEVCRKIAFSLGSKARITLNTPRDFF